MMPMSPSYKELLNSARHWAENCAAVCWLSRGDIKGLMELEDRTPASLFEAGIHRPLVAAFFGGTGVGKSTLLNRLAGQTIARTGVERPTSREVSIYMHESIQFRQLPRNFPMERVRVAHHRDESRRQVLWIDMPDIDSIEQHNHELVLEWLPHIDVLIYVVNPERYRDDKGWRLLQAHGADHAWVFVMNQWDRGHPTQWEDFVKLLATGGFPDPVILRTDSREHAGSRKEDDFEQLQDFLRQMADRHVLHQLEIRTEALRLESLGFALADCLRMLGDAAGYRGLSSEWAAQWQKTGDEILKGLEWPIKTVAREFVGHEANPLRRSLDLNREAAPESSPETPKPRPLLWDDWARDRLADALDLLVMEAGNRGLPAIPLKSGLDRIHAEAGRTVLNQGQLSLRQALANPGNAFQRAALRLSGVLTVVLPLAAIGWVTYTVVKGYYESALEHLAYLGTDFAIHSGLLIAVSWLLPVFAYRKLKPSNERTAVRGLRAGLALAIERIGEQVAELLEQSERKRELAIGEGRRLEILIGSAMATGGDKSSALVERVHPTPAASPETALPYSIRSK